MRLKSDIMSYMGGNYVIFHMLVRSSQEDRKLLIKRLMQEDKEGYEELKNWINETIKIGEEYLGEEYSKEFKELFNCLDGEKMMIDPKSYRTQFENASFDELLSERDRIIEFMRDYENHNLPDEDYSSDPDPEVVYFSNMEYLREICDLIKIRMIDDGFYYKSCRIINCRSIDEELSKLDENEQKEFLEGLKNDDGKLYEEFLEWKKNKEE